MVQDNGTRINIANYQINTTHNNNCQLLPDIDIIPLIIGNIEFKRSLTKGSFGCRQVIENPFNCYSF